MLLTAGDAILLVAAAVASVTRHAENVRPLPIYSLLTSCKAAAIRAASILPLRLTVKLRLLPLLALDLRKFSPLGLAVLALRPTIELGHLPLRLTGLLPENLPVWTLSLPLLSLWLSVPLRRLPLKLRLLALDLRPLSLTVHLRERTLHLRHLPLLYLRTLHLWHLALSLLLRSHLRLLTLDLLRSLTLYLGLTSAAATALLIAAVSAAFTLRGNLAKTTYRKDQQERKKCKYYGSGM